MTSHLTEQRSPSSPSGPIHPNLVIAAMCAAVVLIIAAVAALSPVLSTIGAELRPTQTELQWVVDAFAVTLAALLLPMGALGDRFGRRRLMLIGFAIFVAAAAWGALTTDVQSLIASRALGGVGAALIFPGTLATLTATMAPEKRGLAIALWTASASLGGTIGMVIAGGLVEFFWFGSVFIFLAVAGTLVGILTWSVVPETADPRHAHVDPLGSLLSLVGVGALVIGIIEGPVKGWTDPITVSSLLIGLLSLAAFALWELRSPAPLLDVRLFRLGGFSMGTLLVFAQFLVVFGYFFVAAQYLGFVRDYSPFIIAAALLPVGILLPLMSMKAPSWSSRWGRGRVGAAGLLLMALATGAFALVGQDTPYWLFALALTVFGAGMGLSGPPGTEAIVEALPPAKQGVASAMNDVSRELGGAIGIALLGSALTMGYRASIDDNADSLTPELQEATRDSAAAALAVAEQSGSSAPTIVETVQAAIVNGFSTAMLAATAFLLLAAAVVAVCTPRSTRSQDHATVVTE